MRTIITILGIEKHPKYSITHAVVDDGTACKGFGKDFKVGDKVMVFFDEKWGQIKMAKPIA